MISENVKRIIDLTIGDGNISKNGRAVNARLKLEHSIKQRGYLWHKIKLLEDIGIQGKEQENIKKLNYKGDIREYTTYSYRTLVHPDISTAYKWLYNKGRKAIDKALLKQLDVISLAYWFMDDGTANKTNKTQSKHPIYGRYTYMFDTYKIMSYTLQTNSFTYDEVRLIQYWIKDSFDIDTIIQLARGLPEIRISSIENKDKFRTLIKPYLLPMFYYKMDGVHQFSGLQYISVQSERLSGKASRDEATV